MKVRSKKILKWCFWLIIFGPIAMLLIMLFLVGVFAEIPSFKELEDPQKNLATELISEDGELINTFHVENRSYVSFDELPSNLIYAAIATEDVRFYNHSGIDYRGLMRVAFKSVLMGNMSAGGGSTITQQLAKTLFPRDEATSNFPGSHAVMLVINKLKEWITAVKLERNYTKNEILGMYLNAIFYGGNSYGIRAASNTFFDKEPWELKTEESATLVGMVNKPTRYNPVINYEKSLGRRNHVIRQMSKYGFISKNESDSLQQLPIVLHYQRQDNNSGLAPYFRDMLRRVMRAHKPKKSSYYFQEDYKEAMRLWNENPLFGWLDKNKKPDGTTYNLDRDGLRIYTTINSRMQKYAEEAVAAHLGGNLQKAFFRDMKYKSNKPFSNSVSPNVVENLMNQARRWSARYINLKKEGKNEEEIAKSFATKYKMRVFSWNKKGYVDTIMTPNDSIKYYKSFLRAAFIAVEPSTGYVRAYVGGPNYRYFKYDNARLGKRQIGSTIKPFLYTLAMQEGMTPCDKVLNVPQTFIVGNDTWTPHSTDRKEYIGQTVTLKWGLQKSSNNISAYLMKQFGPRALIDVARKMGISTYLPEVPSLCVGPADVSLWQMVNAFNTFPSRGLHVEPLIVTRIEDKSGNVLGQFTSQKREAISERTAYLMANLMQGVVNGGTAYRLRWKYQFPGEIAGKTGTTNDQADGWFIGYTPKITAGVWVGAENREIHFESLGLGSGSNMALPIWAEFYKRVLADKTLNFPQDDKFVAPAGFVLNLDCDGQENSNTQVIDSTTVQKNIDKEKRIKEQEKFF